MADQHTNTDKIKGALGVQQNRRPGCHHAQTSDDMMTHLAFFCETSRSVRRIAGWCALNNTWSESSVLTMPNGIALKMLSAMVSEGLASTACTDHS